MNQSRSSLMFISSQQRPVLALNLDIQLGFGLTAVVSDSQGLNVTNHFLQLVIIRQFQYECEHSQLHHAHNSQHTFLFPFFLGWVVSQLLMEKARGFFSTSGLSTSCSPTGDYHRDYVTTSSHATSWLDYTYLYVLCVAAVLHIETAHTFQI